MKSDHIPPAQLWIGSHNILTDALITYTQKQFCASQGCGICIPCRQIKAQQHHAVIWICPEKNYTLETLEVIHERIAFALTDEQKVFFILQRADFLTTQCANSLLKSIEEPPQGYHFMLCAERQEYMLPTISSRCIIRSFTKESSVTEYQTLYAYFTAKEPQQAAPFLKEIQNSTISEHQSLDLVDHLFAYWLNQYQQTTDPDLQTVLLKRIELFKQALLKPPMSGSSKLFWKHIFLEYNHIG